MTVHQREAVIWEQIQAERRRQDDKWGEQWHNPIEWIAVLTEEVGEASQEALRQHFGKDPEKVLAAKQAYHREMVQCAAVAVAALERLIRGDEIRVQAGLASELQP